MSKLTIMKLKEIMTTLQKSKGKYHNNTTISIITLLSDYPNYQCHVTTEVVQAIVEQSFPRLHARDNITVTSIKQLQHFNIKTI